MLERGTFAAVLVKASLDVFRSPHFDADEVRASGI